MAFTKKTDFLSKEYLTTKKNNYLKCLVFVVFL